MEVVLINAAASSDVNSGFIADKLAEKYEGCNRFDLCSLKFDVSHPVRKDDSGFKPELVEESLRDAMSAVNVADLIIFIAPNYFSFISGMAKMFLDRFCVFQNFSGMPTFPNKENKKFFFILTQGSPNRSHGQSTQDWMKHFAGIFKMKFFGMTIPNCKGREPEAAKMKIDEISMSLNMFT
ncbi:MAG: hypothetical protein C0602_03220 [Denitrovibrio sp.]|nr:MAG: hypothetical protein C0602_03220 [Denitrovibrio sp.]